MGILIKGQWVTTEDESAETKLAMEKSVKYLRNWITVDGRSFSAFDGFAQSRVVIIFTTPGLAPLPSGR